MTTHALIMVILVLIFHYLANFVFQDKNMSTRRKTNYLNLTLHVLTYSFFWFLALYLATFGENLKEALYFSIITFIFHWLTDYLTGIFNKRLLKEAKISSNYYGFYLGTNLTNLLHNIQLLITLKLLFNI